MDNKKQTTLSDVISRLKAEGDLIRNTGTNSLKTIRERSIAEGNLIRNSGTNSIKSVREIMIDINANLITIGMNLYSMNDNITKQLLKRKEELVTDTPKQSLPNFKDTELNHPEEKPNPTIIKVETPKQSSENLIENSRKEDEQLDVLKDIKENTKGKKEPKGKDKDNKSDWFGNIKGFNLTRWFDGAVESLFKNIGTMIISTIKFIFNPKKLLTLLGKWFVPTAVLLSIGNGVWDAVTEWMNGGSLSDIIVSFFDGFLKAVSFGVINKESLNKLVDGKLDWIFKGIEDFIIEPLSNLFNWIGDSFKSIYTTIANIPSLFMGFINDYIVNPVKNLFNTITKSFNNIMAFIENIPTNLMKNLNENLFDPLLNLMQNSILTPFTEFVKPITELFSTIYNQIADSFKNFGIPEIKLTLPILGEFKIGGIYPFKTKAVDVKLDSPANLKKTENVYNNQTSYDYDTNNVTNASNVSNTTNNIIDYNYLKNLKTNQNLMQLEQFNINPKPNTLPSLKVQTNNTSGDTITNKTNELQDYQQTYIQPNNNIITNAPTNISNNSTTVMRSNNRNPDPTVNSILYRKMI